MKKKKAKKLPQELYEKGQEITLTFEKPMFGGSKMPIAQTKEGIICLIQRKERKGKLHIPYFSIWNCEVIELFDNKIIIEPIEMIVTSGANRLRKEQELLEKFGKQHTKHVAVKQGGQYLSKNEQ